MGRGNTPSTQKGLNKIALYTASNSFYKCQDHKETQEVEIECQEIEAPGMVEEEVEIEKIPMVILMTSEDQEAEENKAE